MARVLVVGKGPPDRGGIAAYLRMLEGSDLSDRHELTFLNLARQGTREGGQFTAGNVRRTLGDAAAVWRESADHHVVHLHSALVPLSTLLRAGVLGLAARARGRRVILHVHGGLVQGWLGSPGRRLMARLALSHARAVAAVSAGTRAALEAVVGSRAVLVPNGVDGERFAPGPARTDVPRVLYVGILTPRKGVVDLLRASAILRERGVDHELWLVGGTPDEGPTGEAEVRAAAGPEVRLLGPRDPEDMPALYREADVLCLPSWWEAAPMSVLEAMASGLPVVATTVGDLPRMVEHERTGLLVQPGRPDALAEALESLLTRPDLRARLGAEARADALQRFPARATTDALARLYETVASSGR